VRRYVGAFATPQNATQQRETFETVDTDEDATSLLVVPVAGDHAGEPVGSVRLHPVNLQRRYANLGVWLLPAARGRGYATEAGAYLLEHAFTDLERYGLLADEWAGVEAVRNGGWTD
jgi:RimJ/RimL family protein N-acetyltransferase